MIKLLVENGADVSCNSGITPLSVIYRDKPENWYEISLFLIENGTDINYYTDWYWDCSSILQDIVHTRPGGSAIDYEPEDPDEVMAAFQYAMENCDHSKVNWTSVLQQSVTFDRIEIVSFLLDKGYCDINDRFGSMTALMFAARDSSKEMVELLLSYGADIELVSEDGKTAYDYAVEFGEEGIADLLK
jgi:ankyrin repeat protein